MSDKGRILKNTVFLYVRMGVVMLVSLYTSRVVLNALGESDFGVYNVVSGLSYSMVFFSTSLSFALQRFFNYEMGVGNMDKVGRIFKLSLLAYSVISLLIVAIGAPVGSWFVANKMVIPASAQSAAQVVLFAMLASLIITFIFSVYESALIAHEEMGIYAWLGILEAGLKLSVAYLILLAPHRLATYAILMAIALLIPKLILMQYCRARYQECKFGFHWNKELFKEVFGFSGLNIYNGLVWVVNEQGVNILLNIFFGPIVNAARGIAVQVNSSVSNFSANFFTAYRPQIIKSYAQRDFDDVRDLLYQSTRILSYMMLLLSLPLIFRAKYILQLWLGEVPDYTVVFVQWVLIFGVIAMSNYPVNAVMLATGHLRKPVLICSNIYLLAFPMCWVALRLGFEPQIVYPIVAIIRFISTTLTLVVIRKDIYISLREYFVKSWGPILLASLAIIPIYFINQVFVENLLGFIIFTICSITITILFIITLGLSKYERKIIIGKIKSKYEND